MNKKEMSEYMSKIVKEYRWGKTTKAQRSAHMGMMSRKRWAIYRAKKLLKK